MSLRLYATPLSHFARKVRIALHEIGVPHELHYVDNLLSSDPVDFGGNLILRIPTLVDGENFVVESDQIVRHLVDTRDPGDRLGRLRLDLRQRNALSMINAAMGAEVEILLSARSGIENIESIPYFQRYFDVIRHCLDWLECHGPHLWTDAEFRYLDVALICMWDHLHHYGTIPELERFTWLGERVARFSARESVARSAPAQQTT